MIRVFIPAYNDSSSDEYKTLVYNVTTELNRGYKLMYPYTFRRTIIINFWQVALLYSSQHETFITSLFKTSLNGSVGVTSQLIFDNQTVVPNITDTEQSLKTAINQSAVFLDVLPASIQAYETNFTSTTISDGTTTAQPTTVTTSRPVTKTTFNSATARTRPKEVVALLLPLILIYFLLTEQTPLL
ncbi:hypothetical protein NFI96_020536 [Prochilodus magdalenae]|nr:hypothetical protein NFI96_020536 [Prochilodus magdalenae]